MAVYEESISLVKEIESEIKKLGHTLDAQARLNIHKFVILALWKASADAKDRALEMVVLSFKNS